NASRQIGSVIGIALFGSLAARSGLSSGLHQSLLIAAAAMVCGGALAAAFGTRRGGAAVRRGPAGVRS
ncbi:MAG TPA: hypothetical protein VF286_10245, partial [Acidiphilium sp.]